VDNQSLDNLLQDKRERQFWLKPVGLPGISLRKQPEEFPESEVEIRFVDRVTNIQDGDILIVYRTGMARLMYVAERLPKSQWTTPEDPTLTEEIRNRYPHFFKTRNLTPEYGVRWSEFNHKPFSLANRLNPLHQDEPALLGAINFHKDRAPIPRWFAEYMIRLMRESQ
jgi:hypothetical protein